MKVSIEISLYPLDRNYGDPIRQFIDRLNTHKNIEIKVQAMSTIIFGEYDSTMEILVKELKSTFSQEPTAVSIIKIVNLDLSD